MKTNRLILLLFCSFLFCCSSLIAQNQLTIDECQLMAKDNYPLIRQYGLIEQSKDYSLSNLSKAYFPQVSLNGQATYQSDVVHFPIQVPGIDIPTIDKDQYKATIDVSQLLWDGGNTASQKKITKAENEVQKQNLEVNLYSIRERVNQLYFGILSIDEQLRQLDILTEDLDNSYKIVNAFLQNGTATQSDVDAVHVELLNTEQKRTELQSFRKAYSEMLSAFIYQKIDHQTILEKPSEEFFDPLQQINRPEVYLYDKQRSLSDARESLVDAKNMPRFSLFLQGGYGKPGLNMLSNDFELFGMGGIRLSWNFGNFYTKSNEKKLIINNKKQIDTQEETFLFNTNLQLTQAYNEIQKVKALMEKDDEIIMLRQRVKTASESKYENGVYTINDLIKDINSENQSRQARILHNIQYLLSIYNYKNISGN